MPPWLSVVTASGVVGGSCRRALSGRPLGERCCSSQRPGLKASPRACLGCLPCVWRGWWWLEAPSLSRSFCRRSRARLSNLCVPVRACTDVGFKVTGRSRYMVDPPTWRPADNHVLSMLLSVGYWLGQNLLKTKLTLINSSQSRTRVASSKKYV